MTRPRRRRSSNPQIVPAGLGKWIQDKDPKKSDRVMKAILGMKKIDLKALQEAGRRSA
jgi:hypothetical protein